MGFELGGLPERELEKLKQEAERLGKGSFAFAFYMDRQKEERERGVTIACTTKEFYTEKWHYTIIDAPGHRDFIKNMITGASQADCSLIMVPGDGNFTTAIAKGNHKAGEIQGQTRQHARLINLLGVKQICVGVNKMDCDVAGYKQSRYDEIGNEMKSTLIKVGWKKDFVEKNTPVMPISGWMGDNLLKKSENMGWWKGMDVAVDSETLHVETLYEVFNNLFRVPARPSSAPMRMPVSGIYKIKGVGDVLAGRVEQGLVKPGEEVVFLPTHTASNPCTGKVFTVEMHHRSSATSRAWTRTTCRAREMSWCTRRTRPWGRPESLMRRSRFSTSPTRSRWDTLRSGLCAAVAPPAESRNSSGRWARRPVERRWRILTPSSPMRWPSAASRRSSRSSATPSRIARACLGLPSWTGTEWSCWARSSLASARRKQPLVAKRSEAPEHG